ncbi:hypothetical protein K439DRAFT_1618884 [Ramaria rubella]|nr:hypothetical protein K439DRAFT_1618884 [Ramaria rubella]
MSTTPAHDVPHVCNRCPLSAVLCLPALAAITDAGNRRTGTHTATTRSDAAPHHSQAPNPSMPDPPLVPTRNQQQATRRNPPTVLSQYPCNLATPNPQYPRLPSQPGAP